MALSAVSGNALVSMSEHLRRICSLSVEVLCTPSFQGKATMVACGSLQDPSRPCLLDDLIRLQTSISQGSRFLVRQVTWGPYTYTYTYKAKCRVQIHRLSVGILCSRRGDVHLPDCQLHEARHMRDRKYNTTSHCTVGMHLFYTTELHPWMWKDPVAERVGVLR